MATSIEHEIDTLYQIPLDEFTAARNALAKSAGSRADEIRKLPKPKAAAWAVNQLYWHHRPIFDQIVKTSTELRKAHVAKVSGKPLDVTALETKHRAALDAGQRKAIELLDAGNKTSSPTLISIERTLGAIPSPAIAGRLAEPIESVGFGLLSGLLENGSARGLADVVSLDRRARAKEAGAATKADGGTKAEQAAASKRAKAEAEARRRERQRLDKELNAAAAAEAAAKTAFAQAKKAVADADARIERLEDQIRAARAESDRRRDELERVRAAANDAAAARVTKERALRLLGDDF